MSRQTNAHLGYLMSEDVYSQVMQGIESMRFLEGLASTAASARIAPGFDLHDLVGYLQLLLTHTYAPLKALDYQHWELVPRQDKRNAAPPVDAGELDPVEEEEQLLRDYRRMLTSDRKHLLRCAAALAFMAEKETDDA